MLKLPSLPITLSVSFICSLFYLPSPGSTQDYPICYMVTSKGQVMNLELMCQLGQQMIAKANACAGPFDTDGFPVVFSQEVQRLKRAIASAKQRNVVIARDAEVQSAAAALRNQMPFANRWGQRMALVRQLQATVDLRERVRLRQQLQANNSQLSTDQCYRKFMQALVTQFQPQRRPSPPAAYSPRIPRWD